MRLTIDRASGAVNINGTTHIVDCISVRPEIARVDWHDDHGSVTYTDGRTTGIGDIGRFREIIDLWNDMHLALRTR